MDKAPRLTCKECAYFTQSTGYCGYWQGTVKPEDVCRQFLATDGSGKVLRSKPVPPKQERIQLSPELVAELVLKGWSYRRIAEKNGYDSASSVSRHLRAAVDKGLIIRKGRGEYVAPAKEEEPRKKEDDKVQKSVEDLRQIGEWILDFDKRLRAMEKSITQAAASLEGAGKQEESAGPVLDADRLLDILEAQQAAIRDLAKRQREKAR